jgi:methionine-gamma-lyase
MRERTAMSSGHEDYGFDTRAIHAGQIDDGFGSVTPGIYQSSTFAFRDAEHGAQCFQDATAGYIYSRLGSPNSRMLEACLASLEGGQRAMSFATGMASLNFLFYALLGQGSHIVLSESIYAPTRLTIEKHWSRFGVEYSTVDSSSLDAVAAAMRPSTKLVHIETPANPTLAISDIAGCAAIAHGGGALLSVDSTFMSPALQRPIEHGADIVMHSLTKFINGHSDALGGILVFADAQLYDSLYKTWYTFGGTMDPHQAWLIQRGVRTLRLRVLQAQENAVKVAALLSAHPAVSRVYYPGLPEHPGHALHARQAAGPGSNISFELAGGLSAGRALMNAVKLCFLAVSLGGVDTLISHPASMTHVGMSGEQRLAAGISDGLVRLSVGIEDADDIVADLAQALDAAAAAS